MYFMTVYYPSDKKIIVVLSKKQGLNQLSYVRKLLKKIVYYTYMLFVLTLLILRTLNKNK